MAIGTNNLDRAIEERIRKGPKQSLRDSFDKTNLDTQNPEPEGGPINDPVIVRYALNIVLRYVEGFDKDEIHASIREQLSTYFIYVNRRDRIPRSDLISIIENVDGIDSVNVFFQFTELTQSQINEF